MDDVTLVMFIFTFLFGLIFTLLGFFDLKGALTKKETPYLGFVYFIVSMIIWFAMAIYWTAMATDLALASLGWLWYGFAGISLACAFACLGYILKASVKVEPEGAKLEIREEQDRGSGY